MPDLELAYPFKEGEASWHLRSHEAEAGVWDILDGNGQVQGTATQVEGPGHIVDFNGRILRDPEMRFLPAIAAAATALEHLVAA